MRDPQTITAAVTFLSPQQGGRSKDVYDSPLYRPHLVLSDPNERVARVDDAGVSTENYLGVQFTGDDRTLPAGIEHHVTLVLSYLPEVDYSGLVSGATFTIREGGLIVGFGHVI
jgi:hypothetical protein